MIVYGLPILLWAYLGACAAASVLALYGIAMISIESRRERRRWREHDARMAERWGRKREL